MENYSKGRNVEEPFSRDNIPIPGLPTDFMWMHVNGGSKMRNLLTPALKAYREEGLVVWSGSGPAIGKTISCCEIMKRTFSQAHQLTKICSRRVEEHWDPKLDTLDPLVVIREIPTIHILLSRDPLNKDELGYQPPGCRDVFWRAGEGSARHRQRPGRPEGPGAATDHSPAPGPHSGKKPKRRPWPVQNRPAKDN